MKKLFLVFLFIIVQMSFAQIPDEDLFYQKPSLANLDNEPEFFTNDRFLNSSKLNIPFLKGNYKIDSIKAEGFQYIINNVPSKTDYLFDNRGNLTLKHIRVFENNTWVNHWKYSYTFNENNDLLTIMLEIWENGSWVIYNKYLYEYDLDGNRILYVQQNLIEGFLTNSYKNIYTYDQFNNLKTLIRYDWVNESWKYDYKDTWSYDDENNPTLKIRNKWLNENWVDDLMSHYYYFTNEGVFIDSIYREAWVNEQWIPSFTRVSKFDEQDNHTYYLQEYYNLEDKRELVMQYDENNNLIHWIDFHWVNE